MYKLNRESPQVWDSPTVAKMFRIREERAIAIMKLKGKEFEQADKCLEALNKLQVLSTSDFITADISVTPPWKLFILIKEMVFVRSKYLKNT